MPIANRELQTGWELPLWVRPVFALLSAGLMCVSFAPYKLWWLAWFALVPLLFALEGAEPHQVRLLGALWGAVFYGFSARWMFALFGFPAVGLIGLLALGPWVFGQGYVVANRRLPDPWNWVALPLLWVGIAYFRSECWYFKFSWFGLGYSQTDPPIFLQVAEVAGSYGLSLFMVAANVLLARAVVPHKQPWRGRLLAGWFATILALSALATVLFVRTVALGSDLETSASRRVALVQDESSDLDSMIRHTEWALRKGAKLVVWPEYAVMGDPVSEEQINKRIAALARWGNAVIVVGGKRFIDEAHKRFYNAAVVFGPEGQVIGEYRKANPVQFFNDGVPGRSSPVFDTPLGKLGIAICYDMDFPWVMRRLTQGGAELLAVPTYDAMWWGKLQHQQHSAMTAMRAVEHRRWVVWAASSGESQLVSPDGIVRRRLPIGRCGVLTGSIAPSRPGLTLYDRGGWLLAPLCLALTCALFFWDIVKAVLTRRQNRVRQTGGASALRLFGRREPKPGERT